MVISGTKIPEKLLSYLSHREILFDVICYYINTKQFFSKLFDGPEIIVIVKIGVN